MFVILWEAEPRMKLRLGLVFLGLWFLVGNREKSPPSVATILALIDTASYSLPSFLGSIVSIDFFPSLRERSARELSEKNLHIRFPWIAAYLLYISTKQYKSLKNHKESTIGEKLGITAEEEDFALSTLCDLKVIAKVGNKFELLRKKHLDVMLDFEGNRQLRVYWMERSVQYMKAMKTGNSKSIYGYMVFAADEELLQKVREKHVALYQDVKDLLATSEVSNPDRVLLMNLNLFDVGDFS